LLGRTQSHGVAEIRVPRAVDVVAQLPLLGSGKVDYPAVQRLAEAWLAWTSAVSESG
jgi:acyl-[acyl-carrier-protein]-phospholipid O-acyltransferase/long-chain-fatty-acid--[acyl-carrier-protein] ligase